MTRKRNVMWQQRNQAQPNTLPSARQSMKRRSNLNWVLSIIGLLVLLALIGVIALGYVWQWGWTGISSKTLWDWLQLLIIPAILAIGGFWLSQIQKNREEKTTEQRTHVDREIATDNQREAALQVYLDQMSNLLLQEKLRQSPDDSEVRRIATLQTLAVLPRLDGKRKGNVLLFLSEAGLIEKDKPIVMLGAAGLHGADFSGIDMSTIHHPDLGNIFISYAALDRVHLQHVHLHGTMFEGTTFCEATLTKANLSQCGLLGVDFSNAHLTGANLTDAEIVNVNFRGANLTNVDFTGARLQDVDFTDALVTPEQLDKTKTRTNIILPDGSRMRV